MRTRWWIVLLCSTTFVSAGVAFLLGGGYLEIEASDDESDVRTIEESEQRKVAVHEAGHAVVAVALAGPEEIERISVNAELPDDGIFGWCRTRTHRRLDTRRDIFNEASVFLGGRAADKLVNGAPTNGAGRDLSHVSDLFWTMHLASGLGDSLLVQGRNEAPPAVRAAVVRDIDAANACAEAVIGANRPVVEALADLIMAQPLEEDSRTLSGEDFRAFLLEHPLEPPVRAPDGGPPAPPCDFPQP